ncbi:MAG TPA: type 4a pilus biogenesis protein PilO [Syntrophales bacterium]|nr:type 4a pilus biogenesis protein PilO [Syntrophales bacterium]HOL59860.1 type 4a pilus biogenesis protein PilO [Syntrophales bacterium]HPO36007.1 type 4a pilus biogenesis protein PilO [Syntrophales bacterium]
MAIADDWKKMPMKTRVAIVAGLYLLAVIGYWFYLLGPVMAKRSQLQGQIKELNEKIADRERVVKEKDRYLSEVRKLEEMFREAVIRLPDRREIPGLFHAVSVAGKEAGLEFLLFEPAPPKVEAGKAKPGEEVRAAMKPSDKRAEEQEKKETKGTAPAKGGEREEKFYEEIPVKVKVMGNFVDTVYFFDRVAKLPRIVHISDVQMGEGKYGAGKRRIIATSCTLKTYMFKETGKKGNEKK